MVRRRLFLLEAVLVFLTVFSVVLAVKSVCDAPEQLSDLLCDYESAPRLSSASINFEGPKQTLYAHADNPISSREIIAYLELQEKSPPKA